MCMQIYLQTYLSHVGLQTLTTASRRAHASPPFGFGASMYDVCRSSALAGGAKCVQVQQYCFPPSRMVTAYGPCFFSFLSLELDCIFVIRTASYLISSLWAWRDIYECVLFYIQLGAGMQMRMYVSFYMYLLPLGLEIVALNHFFFTLGQNRDTYVCLLPSGLER